MITRRQLLTGIAGGVAAATVAATLVRAKTHILPYNADGKGHVVHPGNSDVGFYGAIPQDANTGWYCPSEGRLTFASNGVEVMRIVPGPPVTMYIKEGVVVEDILKIAKGQPV